MREEGRWTDKDGCRDEGREVREVMAGEQMADGDQESCGIPLVVFEASRALSLPYPARCLCGIPLGVAAYALS